MCILMDKKYITDFLKYFFNNCFHQQISSEFFLQASLSHIVIYTLGCTGSRLSRIPFPIPLCPLPFPLLLSLFLAFILSKFWDTPPAEGNPLYPQLDRNLYSCPSRTFFQVLSILLMDGIKLLRMVKTRE